MTAFKTNREFEVSVAQRRAMLTSQPANKNMSNSQTHL